MTFSRILQSLHYMSFERKNLLARIEIYSRCWTCHCPLRGTIPGLESGEVTSKLEGEKIPLLMTTIIDVRLMLDEWGDYFQFGVTVMNYDYMNLMIIEGAVAVPGTLIQLQRKATVGEEHLPLPENLSQRGEVSRAPFSQNILSSIFLTF